ncbi:MAG TPA: response regulator [Anaeromyxobacter sp.]|nr:response regulator [Anaeromyxobacter sp.]
MRTAEPVRILVVEDEPDVREFLLSALSHYALVEAAADGEEALQRMARGPLPSVVLLDLRMPGLSGDGVLRALEGIPGKPPVVTMSASTREVPRGAAAHLEKPFTMGEAVAVLERVLLEAGRALGGDETTASPVP